MLVKGTVACLMCNMLLEQSGYDSNRRCATLVDGMYLKAPSAPPGDGLMLNAGGTFDLFGVAKREARRRLLPLLPYSQKAKTREMAICHLTCAREMAICHLACTCEMANCHLAGSA